MPVEILLLTALGLAVAVVVTARLARRRVTGTLRRELGAAPGDDFGRVIRELRSDAAEARTDSTRAREDLGQIGELLETGVVHIAADLRVTSANRAAHWLLGQRAGSLVGRSAMEAFVDHRMEGLVRTATRTGATSTELATLGGSDRIVLVRARQATTGGIWLVLEDVTELVRTETMRERKGLMDDRSDAFVVLPGGIGTLEELVEILTLKQLGYHDRAIVVLDAGGYWDPFLAQLDRMVELGLAAASLPSLLDATHDVAGTVAAIRGYRPRRGTGDVMDEVEAVEAPGS